MPKPSAENGYHYRDVSLPDRRADGSGPFDIPVTRVTGSEAATAWINGDSLGFSDCAVETHLDARAMLERCEEERDLADFHELVDRLIADEWPTYYRPAAEAVGGGFFGSY